jgi:hypothetical protein
VWSLREKDRLTGQNIELQSLTLRQLPETRGSRTMSRSRLVCVMCWCLSPLVSVRTVAQSSPKADPVELRNPASADWSHKIISFSDEKVVLGLPEGYGRMVKHCSDDGTTFVEIYPDSKLATSPSVPILFSVSTDGEVMNVHRVFPLDFTEIHVRDFFAADQTLVTLLEAVKRDDRANATVGGDITYFISLSDHSGSGAKLLPLDLKFKPIKVAVFGSGDFLMLGWDEVNLHPLLAVLKDDGALRRFIDLDDRRNSEPYVSYGSRKEEEASPRVQGALASLQKAEFVPYGSEVLLTYPGTAKSISVFSAVGQDRTIPIKWPGGFVLHDVLVSGARYPLILRVLPTEISEQAGREGESTILRQRLFEFHAFNGSLLREFQFQKPGIGEVTCASASTLTAMFFEKVAKPDRPETGLGDSPTAAENAMQFVIATASRW